MKTLFLILNLLTDGDAIRSLVHSCFNVALASVGVLFLVGAYQMLRHSCLRGNTATPSRA